jgi:catecholate siderophore receptor
MTKTIRRPLITGVLSILISGAITPIFRAQSQVPAPKADTLSTDSASTATPKSQTLNVVRIRGKRDAAYAPDYSRTGTKSTALPRDVPQSITIVNKQLIRDQSMQGIADVVRYVPGISISQGEGNRDQVTIRGNSSTADFFVDGVRDDVQYFRDTYNLESVEALKGSNAMVFGRGGGGGVLNRVTKLPQWNSSRVVTIEGGSFDKRRASVDLQQSLSGVFAARVNSLYENSGSFRDGVTLERSGINPTLSLATTSRSTKLDAGYEYFRDHRTADRGVPSIFGEPVRATSTFFGNADESYSNAIVKAVSATLSHDAGRLQLRNHSRFADYDKVYQNVFPGAVDPTRSEVSISGYRNAVERRNAFNQTDLTWTMQTWTFRHDALIGAEFGRQKTESFRETAYFGTASTATVNVPLSNPLATAAVNFKQSPTDADHGTTANTRSVYIQDQLSLNDKMRLIGGARFETFDVRYRDDRTPARLKRTDEMWSPRIGLVLKPSEVMSVYASYSLSFLPGSGDQFSSLTEVTSGLRPERFSNYEAGMKWDVLDRLALTGAVYRLDRTNTRAPNPADPTRVIQTGKQRSTGVELSAAGTIVRGWDLAAGIARQNARIESATIASPAGATVPLVPTLSASLWNKVSLTTRIGVAVGAIHQGKTYAAIDNKVTLPSFNRLDAAAFLKLAAGLRAQANLENLLNRQYFPTAQGNNNISPGAPRTVRVSLGADF